MDIEIIVLMLTILTIYFAFIRITFAAKPNLRIRFKDGKKEAELVAGEEATIKLHIENRGHWFAKPAAHDVFVYANFDPTFHLTELKYGSALEKSNQEVKIGKGGRKYLKAEGIHLFYEEPGEDIEVYIKAPEKEGRYRLEIAADSREGGYRFQRLWLNVIKVA